MNQSPLIQIQHLYHRYPKANEPALDDVSFSIPRGCSFGLLGPNGAGKTTLLSLLTGLQSPQSGAIHIAGQDINHSADLIKAISAYVPQEHAFYLALTGRENLRFFADIYGLSRQQWRDRLDYVVSVCSLQELLDKRTERYSGGMKRRLNLAIGLLNTPQILYLDEPTVGVDAVSRQLIVESIQQLRAQGTTVIYTSHYMEEVEALCDELAIINHGRLVVRDSTANLMQQDSHKTLLLTFNRPLESTALAALQAWSPQLLRDCQLQLSVTEVVELAEILGICRQQQWQVTQAQFGVSKLEQIYLSLLQGDALPRELVA
jgi:ABC-2 type transport system ATP-binding protein